MSNVSNWNKQLVILFNHFNGLTWHELTVEQNAFKVLSLIKNLT